MEDTSIVRGDVMCIEKEAFLYWSSVSNGVSSARLVGSHRLKLVTGVDISTRPVSRCGSEGNAKNSSSLRAAAVAYSRAFSFRRSITMIVEEDVNMV